jgi:hypothetical protein
MTSLFYSFSPAERSALGLILAPGQNAQGPVKGGKMGEIALETSPNILILYHSLELLSRTFFLLLIFIFRKIFYISGLAKLPVLMFGYIFGLA